MGLIYALYFGLAFLSVVSLVGVVCLYKKPRLGILLLGYVGVCLITAFVYSNIRPEHDIVSYIGLSPFILILTVPFDFLVFLVQKGGIPLVAGFFAAVIVVIWLFGRLSKKQI
jgi:hypothetical protein